MSWRNDFDEPGHRSAAGTNLNGLSTSSGGSGSAGHTKADTQAMNQAADALVGLRGSTDQVDNDADEKTLDASSYLNKNSLGTTEGDGSWETSGGLLAMDVRWGDQVINLKNLLRDISEKLHETRNSYTKREIEENNQYQRMHPDFG
ncbi:hypothetical protein [Streptomyces luteolus]|uniref:Uncharacterized protein n=1 Tax=Streptomyces luteolus TaxID=3043615 RepID=A0ABT6SV87_9ACTN|nr:hypothetical protein [Streptomyces sp. B-S-A12]MDI3419501.1 hypothetical protein [Streptomyces sp. B-S-A12]